MLTDDFSKLQRLQEKQIESIGQDVDKVTAVFLQQESKSNKVKQRKVKTCQAEEKTSGQRLLRARRLNFARNVQNLECVRPIFYYFCIFLIS